MIGIGIDTGGTFTDAVIIDTVTKDVLSFGKSPTTPYNLKEGILNSLGKLDSDLVKEAGYISLSTTLATNACVENKGGRAKLVFIGVPKNAVDRMEGTYGLPDSSEIYFLNGNPAKPLSEENVPDWQLFEQDLREQFSSYDSVAVVQINPSYNNGEYEKHAAELIEKILEVPCIKGYDLYQELNVQKRGATALLNARLLPVMDNFFDSIAASMSELNLDIPIKVVKSNGTIMSEEMARKRPVETLLCGPAACIIGALHLSSKENALILDMGGTTSDVAMLKDRIPMASESGINIGQWNTMVKGISIDTFALGGDSSVELIEGEITLSNRRAIPLCMLASRYPHIIDYLENINFEYKFNKKIKERNFFHFFRQHIQFLLLVRMPANLDKYTKHEQNLIKILKDGPRSISEATEMIGLSVFSFSFSRLEDEGIILRSTITPTDAMHVLEDYMDYNVMASQLAIECVAQILDKTPNQIAIKIYDKVKEKLYLNIARILYNYSSNSQMSSEEFELLKELSKNVTFNHDDKLRPYLQMKFFSNVDFIGIGAPTAIFMKDVADEMNMDYDFPLYGPVANAVGAALGKYSEKYSVTIQPNTDKDIKKKYKILGDDKIIYDDSYDYSLKLAKEIANRKAKNLLRKHGDFKEYEIKIEIDEDFFDVVSKGKRIFVQTDVTATIEA